MTKLKLRVWIMLLIGVFSTVWSLDKTGKSEKIVKEADDLVEELKLKLEEYNDWKIH